MLQAKVVRHAFGFGAGEGRADAWGQCYHAVEGAGVGQCYEGKGWWFRLGLGWCGLREVGCEEGDFGVGKVSYVC